VKPNRAILFLFLAIAGVNKSNAQSIGPSVINTNGGSGTISGSSFDWSVGEIMTTTGTGSSVIVTQGLLQPAPYPTIGVTDKQPQVKLDVFPVPASTLVNIRLNAPSTGALSYKLLDMTGKVLLENSTEVKQGNNLRQLDIQRLACASYMLQVVYKGDGTDENTSVYTIQKLN